MGPELRRDFPGEILNRFGFKEFGRQEGKWSRESQPVSHLLPDPEASNIHWVLGTTVSPACMGHTYRAGGMDTARDGAVTGQTSQYRQGLCVTSRQVVS